MFQHKYKYGFIVFIIIYSFLNIIVLNGDRLFKVQLPGEYLFAVVTFLCFGIWFLNIAIEKYLVTQIHGVHPLISHFIISVLGLCLLAMVSVGLTTLLLGEPFTFSFKNLMLTSAFLFRVNLFLNTINAVVFFNTKYREKELETEKMRLASLNARYEVLNNQINPHFLFNSLNTLSSLLVLDIQKAEKFLQKLSETYRYLLKNKSNDLILLKEELDFIENYADLLNIRFEKALSFTINISDELKQLYIPPTVLQLLIENVVKHNYFTEKQTVNIEIKENMEGNLIVKNNLRLKESNRAYSSGIGLKNIAERYKFFNQKINIVKTENFFEVELPLIGVDTEPKKVSRSLEVLDFA